MARSGALGGGTFADLGGSFSIFNVVSQDQTARLALAKVENDWNNGLVGNDVYLTALQTYANVQTPGSLAYLDAQQRVTQTTYTLGRNTLISKVQQKQAPWSDLVDFDRAHLTGLDPTSDEYRQRLNSLQNSQQGAYSDAEKTITDAYSAGQMTAAQALAWFQDQAPSYSDNPDLADAIKSRITDFTDRSQREQDAQVKDDYQHGKMSASDYLTYASHRQAAYAPGTQDAKQWKAEYDDAKKNVVETNLLYRYGLSAKYAQLEQFVKSNAAKGGGGTSTSHQTRQVLGADGHWHTVTTTTTKAIKPSASEVAAHASLQSQIADAKQQMAALAKQINGNPGGWVTDKDMVHYYSQLQAGTIKGTPQWYAYQDKIDGFHDRIHQTEFLGKSGVKITFPPVASDKHGNAFTPDAPIKTTAPAAGPSHPAATANMPVSGGGGSSSGSAAAAPPEPHPASSPTHQSNTTLDQFMAAIAHFESGGRYDARNSSTGAFGKYQILPSSWAAFAHKAGLPAGAQPTPKNQEIVARAAFESYYKVYKGDWSKVAAAWHAGVAGSKNPGPATLKYVSSVMGYLGHAKPAPAPKAAATSHVPGFEPPKTKKGTVASGLEQIVGAYGAKVRNPQLQPFDFPVNMDATAFTKLYGSILAAVNAGKENLVLSLPNGKSVNLFIPTDSKSLTDMVSDLDNRMIDLRKTQFSATKGTYREATTAAEYNTAVTRAYTNQITMLDVASSDTGTPGHVSNPLAKGLLLLDKTKTAIADHVAAAKEAFDRGDYDTAYAQSKFAADMAAESSVYVSQLGGYLGQTTAELGALTAAGGKESGTVKSDFEKLSGFADEIAQTLKPGEDLVGNPGSKSPDTLSYFIQMDGQGNAVTDSSGALVYVPGFIRHVDPHGVVKGDVIPPSGYAGAGNAGQQSYNVKNEQEIHVVMTNGSVLDAYAPVHTDTIGYIVGPDGQQHPVSGRVVSFIMAGTNTPVMVAENPFSPGQWLPINNKPMVWSAPKGFAVVPAVGADGTPVLDANGNPLSSFSFAPGDGMDYKLIANADGTWTVMKHDPNNIDDKTNTVPLSMSDLEAQQALSGAGLSLDLGKLDDDQRGYASLGSDGIKGAWAGASPSQVVSFLTSRQRKLDTTPSPMLAGDTRSENRRIGLTQPPVYGAGTTESLAGKAADDLNLSARNPLPVIGTPPSIKGSSMTGGKGADDVALSLKPIKPITPKKPPTPLAIAKGTGSNERNIDKLTPAPKPKPIKKPAPLNTAKGIGPKERL